MLVWVPDEHLEFTIQDAMRGVRLPAEPDLGRCAGRRRAALTKLEEDQRRILAKAVMERMRISRWRVVRLEVRPHGTPDFKWRG